MKLSFSIPSKSSSKQNPIKPADNFDGGERNNDQSKEYVTEFDASRAPTKSTKIVIPPLQNEWRPYKRMKNLEIPTSEPQSSELQFELDSSSAAAVGPDSGMSYGLNLRKSEGSKGSEAGAADEGNEGQGRSDATPLDELRLQKLKMDLNKLDDARLEDFSDVPVEGFAEALLSGFGWSEGMGIGRNAKENVKIKQYEKWTAKEGVGFVRESLPVRSSKEKDRSKEREKEVVKDGFSVGKSVRIVRGKDMGLKGRVLERIGNDWAVLKLSKSEEEVKLRIGDVAELGSEEEERCLMKLKESRIRVAVGEDSNNKHSRDRGRRSCDKAVVEVKNGDTKGDRKEKHHMKKEASWLTSHIRVRIISKDFKGGRLYLKKGEILDVVGPTTCDISMDDDKEIIQGVPQQLLETALPKRGGPVLVLYGKHKGAYGSLVERDLDREVGVVRDADTHALLYVRLEQIAEYMGDPSYLGY